MRVVLVLDERVDPAAARALRRVLFGVPASTLTNSSTDSSPPGEPAGRRDQRRARPSSV